MVGSRCGLDHRGSCACDAREESPRKKVIIVPRWTVPLDCAKRESRVLKSSDAAKRERVRPRNRVDRDARSCPRGHTVMLSFLAQTPALVASRIFSLSPRTPIHLIRYWSDLEVSHPGHGVTATPASAAPRVRVSQLLQVNMLTSRAHASTARSVHVGRAHCVIPARLSTFCAWGASGARARARARHVYNSFTGTV